MRQETFDQAALALDSDQVRIRELSRLAVAAGLRSTLLAINAAAGADAHAAVERGELARRLECAASTVSRRCGQLVEFGLVRRAKLGNRAAWSIEWAAVLDGAVGSGQSAVGARRTSPTAKGDGDACSRNEFREHPAPAGGGIGADVVAVIVRLVVGVLVGPCVCARWCLRVDARLRSALAVSAARRVRDGVHSPCEDEPSARRSRGGRQTLALPFVRDFAVGGGADGVQVRERSVMHTPQLANADSTEIAASRGSSGGEEGIKKTYLRIDWDACRVPAGSLEQFQKLVAQGLVSIEDRDEWQMFLQAVRRRSRGEGTGGEKTIKSPAAYIARVIQDGTWRGDIRPVDRKWWADEVERVTSRPVAVGTRDEGRRELTESGRRFVERLAKKG